MPDTVIPNDVYQAFAVAKPTHRIVELGADVPADDFGHRYVFVLAERDHAPHRYVVWMFVLSTEQPPFCSSGYYTNGLADARADLERRR